MANEQPLSARGEVKARWPHLYEGGDGKPLLGIDDVHHAVLRVLEGDEIVGPIRVGTCAIPRSSRSNE